MSLKESVTGQDAHDFSVGWRPVPATNAADRVRVLHRPNRPLKFAPRGNSATVHFWSLAIEEQFYLLWPITIVLLGLSKRWRLWVLQLLRASHSEPLLTVETIECSAPASLQAGQHFGY
jgi:hypothetical protein